MDRRFLFGEEPELFPGVRAGARKDAEHEPLSEYRREGRDAHVVVVIVKAKAHAPVLRQAAFGNVHRGEDFQPRADGGIARLGEDDMLFPFPVDAEVHAHELLFGRKMDVARFEQGGGAQQRFREEHGGRVFGDVVSGRRFPHAADGVLFLRFEPFELFLKMLLFRHFCPLSPL